MTYYIYNFALSYCNSGLTSLLTCRKCFKSKCQGTRKQRYTNLKRREDFFKLMFIASHQNHIFFCIVFGLSLTWKRPLGLQMLFENNGLELQLSVPSLSLSFLLIQTEITTTASDTFWHLLLVALFHDKHPGWSIDIHVWQQCAAVITDPTKQQRKPQSYFWPRPIILAKTRESIFYHRGYSKHMEMHCWYVSLLNIDSSATLQPSAVCNGGCWKHTNTHRHTQAQTRTYTCTYAHTDTHNAQTQPCTLIYKQMHIYYTHTHSHTDTETVTHINTYSIQVHTYTCTDTHKHRIITHILVLTTRPCCENKRGVLWNEHKKHEINSNIFSTGLQI